MFLSVHVSGNILCHYDVIFLVVIPCSIIGGHRRFGRHPEDHNLYFHLRGKLVAYNKMFIFVRKNILLQWPIYIFYQCDFIINADYWIYVLLMRLRSMGENFNVRKNCWLIKLRGSFGARRNITFFLFRMNVEIQY